MSQAMTEIISLKEYRNKISSDYTKFIKTDQDGITMYKYVLSYNLEGSWWSGVTVWAYSFEDAELRVAAMKESLNLDGQLIEEI